MYASVYFALEGLLNVVASGLIWAEQEKGKESPRMVVGTGRHHWLMFSEKRLCLVAYS